MSDFEKRTLINKFQFLQVAYAGTFVDPPVTQQPLAQLDQGKTRTQLGRILAILELIKIEQQCFK